MAESTIAAISTALGEGGIAVVRVSGPDAVSISTKILKRKDFPVAGKLYLTSLINSQGVTLDRVLAVNFKAPHSYTGEEIFEIHTHGGIFVARTCLELLLQNGATLAGPGEFTRRAFTNGRINLSQAEGVLGIIKARSLEALKASARTLTGDLSRSIQEIHDEILNLQASIEINLDFPEGEIFDAGFDSLEEIKKIIAALEKILSRCETGLILNEGINVILAGRPNVGKSSLLNALTEKNRAIVTEIPGTTRDIISDTILINGLPVKLSDTAGLRSTENIIEAEGVKLARQALKEGDLCLFVLDAVQEISSEEIHEINLLGDKALIVFNKCDLNLSAKIDSPLEKIFVSAKTGQGLEDLKAAIYNKAIKTQTSGEGLTASITQIENLKESLTLIREAQRALLNDTGSDVAADMLSAARVTLLNVLGSNAGDELLDYMFGRFCVGK